MPEVIHKLEVSNCFQVLLVYFTLFLLDKSLIMDIRAGYSINEKHS
jgi:hypothetical protein